MDGSAQRVVTVVDASIDPDRVADLLAGFEALVAGPTPDALVSSQLLRGADGTWRIETVWRDLDSLKALRSSGEAPSALALLDRLGAEHTHGFFTVERSLSR